MRARTVVWALTVACGVSASVRPDARVQEKDQAIVYVVGAVQQNGRYYFTPGTLTVAGAIALAGGFRDRADRDAIYIQRVVDGQKRRIAVTATAPVEPNDTVVVPAEKPRSAAVAQNSVMGIPPAQSGQLAAG